MAAAVQALRSKYGIAVTREWASVQSLPHGSAIAQAKKLYDLWLCADLRETAPSEARLVGIETKGPLKTDAYLQICDVLNVAESAYAQLEKAQRAQGGRRQRGADTSLDEANSAPQSLVTSTRKLLKLRFTDGHSFVVGMEFQPLSNLRLDVPPGTKVRVKTGTLVRNKTLLLVPGGIDILGGEVRAMHREHNFVRVLERCFPDEDEGEEEEGMNADNGGAQPGHAAQHHALPASSVGANVDAGAKRRGPSTAQPRAANAPKRRPAVRAAQAGADGDDDDEDILLSAAIAAEGHDGVPVGRNDEAQSIVIGDDDDDDDDITLLAALEESEEAMGPGRPAANAAPHASAAAGSNAPRNVSRVAVPVEVARPAGQWIKGPIVEFVEQLTNSDGQWSMKVAVEDEATRQRHVFKLSDQVITLLAGMSAEQFRAEKKAAKRDPSIKARLAEILNHVEAVLSSSKPGHFRVVGDAANAAEAVEAKFDYM